MNNQIRNELIELMYLSQNKEDKKYIGKSIDSILRQIELDLERRIVDAKYTIKECEENLKILEEVKKILRRTNNERIKRIRN